MHIAFLNSIEKDVYGGMEEWIRLAAVGLTKRGHTITLIGRQDSCYLQRAGGSDGKIKILPVDISSDFNPATITKIKNYLNDHSVDVLTVNFNKDVRLGGLAARWNKETKVVWSVGLNITKDSLVHKLLTPKLVDKVIVPSESLKREITALGYIDKEITTVIPISIENLNETPDKQTAREKILKRYDINGKDIIAVISGRFVEQKGHKYLVEAAAEIIKNFRNITFLLLGDGPLREKLEKSIAFNKLDNHFKFAGMLDDINEELAAADIMIHPSIFEPFGIAILEGMRAGLPVVASRIGGIPEVVEEGYNAVLVEPARPAELSQAVVALLSNRELLNQYGHNSQERFRRYFQMERMTDSLEQLYKSVESETVRRD